MSLIPKRKSLMSRFVLVNQKHTPNQFCLIIEQKSQSSHDSYEPVRFSELNLTTHRFPNERHLRETFLVNKKHFNHE